MYHNSFVSSGAFSSSFSFLFFVTGCGAPTQAGHADKAGGSTARAAATARYSSVHGRPDLRKSVYAALGTAFAASIAVAVVLFARRVTFLVRLLLKGKPAARWDHLPARVGKVRYTAVRREHNELADRLVNEALDALAP